MARIRTQIGVTGITADEARNGIADVLEYLGEREWLLKVDAIWDDDSQRIIVVVEREGNDPDLEAKATIDEVWDCVIAAIHFSSELISFDILKSEPVDAVQR